MKGIYYDEVISIESAKLSHLINGLFLVISMNNLLTLCIMCHISDNNDATVFIYKARNQSTFNPRNLSVTMCLLAFNE